MDKIPEFSKSFYNHECLAHGAPCRCDPLAFGLEKTGGGDVSLPVALPPPAPRDSHLSPPAGKLCEAEAGQLI